MAKNMRYAIEYNGVVYRSLRHLFCENGGDESDYERFRKLLSRHAKGDISLALELVKSNKRKNTPVEANGVVYPTIKDFSSAFNIPIVRVRNGLSQGFSGNEIISSYEDFKNIKSIEELCTDANLDYDNVLRFKNNYGILTYEDAISDYLKLQSDIEYLSNDSNLTEKLGYSLSFKIAAKYLNKYGISYKYIIELYEFYRDYYILDFIKFEDNESYFFCKRNESDLGDIFTFSELLELKK